MRPTSRLVAILLFAVLGMFALILAGLLDWIVGVLFLAMEFLGGALRSVVLRDRSHRIHAIKSRQGAGPKSSSRLVRPVNRLRRKRPALILDESSGIPPGRRSIVLVALSDDEPDLLEFALEECRIRRARLVALFLRPLAVIPMGPVSLPGLSEDESAMGTLDRIAADAESVGVPVQTIYATTGDRPATIAEFARNFEADVVVVGSRKKSGIARLLVRDHTAVLMRLLPVRSSLMIRGV